MTDTKIEPVPMILHCPGIINSGKAICGARHIDTGEFATTKIHHTHSCQSCGHTWRPAVVPTVGVQFLPGFKSADDEGSAERAAAGDRQGVTDGWAGWAIAKARRGYARPMSAMEEERLITETRKPSSPTEQEQIDKTRTKHADEIVAAQNLDTLEGARIFARNWIVTAMQHCANENYWRERAEKAEAVLKLPPGRRPVQAPEPNDSSHPRQPTPPCSLVGHDDSEPEESLPILEEVLKNLRMMGWKVAAHNDYRLNGEDFTFWLLRKDDHAVKGEAKTDLEALRLALVEITRIQREEIETLRLVRRAGQVTALCFGSAQAVRLPDSGIMTNGWKVINDGEWVRRADGSAIWCEEEAIAKAEELGGSR